MKIKNPELELAWNFVEKTNRNIFLTGKAGTGKTTFLRKIKKESLKRMVVVAPTGVAAINAKGVTIHSFFQMPFGPILPENAQQSQQDNKYQKKFAKKKIDIIRSLDLLVIDEISMVRADLLDGIDQVLRRYKNRDQVFGGVQILMIGDLQQLSPVVKPNEWQLLQAHYFTPYFFSSKSFQQSNAIGIELKHIYRQDNQEFIQILNEIRNNNLSQESAKALNKRHIPNFSPGKDEGYITLTTHNNRANEMNKVELQKLSSKSFKYQAEIEKDFPKQMFPTFEQLELKEGAQVMFIKNDSDQAKRFFNGKIGTIVSLNNTLIKVQCPGDTEEIVVGKEVWENVKYSINKSTKDINEDVVGSFTQFPLRLAWAITIHKSQGLTFEKAIIDAEESFAHGQTYVALSRCKTLEGIVLTRPIQPESIINDSRVTTFTKQVEDNLPNEEHLNRSQKAYQLSLMANVFDYQLLIFPIKRLISIYYNFKTSLRGNIIDPLMAIQDKGIFELQKVGRGFNAQLQNLSATVVNPEMDPTIQERLKKGIQYFLKFTEEQIKIPFDSIEYSTDNQAVNKDFKKQMTLFQERLNEKLFILKGLEKDGFSTTKVLNLRAKAVLFEAVKPKRPKKVYTATEHPELFNELKQYRNKQANADEVPHYVIFPQDTLFELCEFLPRTEKELLAISGMGKGRVEKYGKEILEIVLVYCAENGAEPKKNILEIPPVTKKISKGTTAKATFDLFKSGKSISEVASARGLAKSTIEGHLSNFILTGDLDILDLMDKDKYIELKKIMETTEYDSFSQLKSKIDRKFSYADLRAVLNDIKFRNDKKE